MAGYFLTPVNTTIPPRPGERKKQHIQRYGAQSQAEDGLQ